MIHHDLEVLPFALIILGCATVLVKGSPEHMLAVFERSPGQLIVSYRRDQPWHPRPATDNSLRRFARNPGMRRLNRLRPPSLIADSTTWQPSSERNCARYSAPVPVADDAKLKHRNSPL